jgi:hypothetical protein
MAHTFAHGRLARRLSLVGALTLAATVVIAPATRAADQPDIRTLSLSISGGAASRAALTVDSDGDGWTDWIERLYGTNPKDPNSHPQQVTAEIVGSTIYLQAPAFPDRLVVISVALPESTVAGSSLLPTVTDLAGITPNSKLGQQIKQLLGSMYDGGVLATALASLDKGQSSLPGFGNRTNGMDISLISSADAISWDQWKKVKEGLDFVRDNNISVGSTTEGNPYITVSNSDGRQTHVYSDDGSISSYLENTVIEDDGTVVLFWTTMSDGVILSYGKRVTRSDGSSQYWSWDAAGNETGSGTTPPKPAGGSSPGGATGGATNQPTGGTTATGGATGPTGGSSDSTDKPTATSSSSYTNPDADPYVAPTPKEVQDRIAFLTGVRVRTVENKPQVTGTILPKPGVSDPEDPACKGSMCVFFVEVSSPTLHQVAGGDPVPPDLPAGTATRR